MKNCLDNEAKPDKGGEIRCITAQMCCGEGILLFICYCYTQEQLSHWRHTLVKVSTQLHSSVWINNQPVQRPQHGSVAS